MWEYRRRVRYYETDRMGVVHHSNYLRFLEDARMDWIRDHIITYSEMEKMGIIIPVVSATGKFKSFLRYDDEFAVRIFPAKFTGVRICLRYEVYNTETGVLCYEGESEHYLAADGDYRPMSIKKKYPELYEAFRKAFKKPLLPGREK
jgi:acyl-CoA thioester hydrolase